MDSTLKNTGGCIENSTGQLEALVTEHETALLRYATGILNNPHAAQDVVQNVFIKLCRIWKKGDRPSRAIRGWLYRVTHNEAMNYIRGESRLRLLHTRHAETKLMDCPDGHNCEDGTAERMELVLQQVRKLDTGEQQVLLLRLQEGLSYQEISAITGRTEGNVGCILHHAVRKIAKNLKPQMNTDERRQEE